MEHELGLAFAIDGDVDMIDLRAEVVVQAYDIFGCRSAPEIIVSQGSDSNRVPFSARERRLIPTSFFATLIARHLRSGGSAVPMGNFS